jgi:uncharacterized protein (TIGR02611 family)
MKRAVVAVLGIVLLLIGIALIVLPGPGFLLIAGALALLATQFDWAKVPLDYAKAKAEDGIDEIARSKFRASLAFVCALALIALGVVELTGVNIPYVNGITAACLILSGLFLVGTMVYALRKAGSARPGQEVRVR